nr:MAG TPA: hypothetical protein [Caudoviricetes sp.]
MITSVLFQQDIFRTYVLPSDLYPYYTRTFVRFQYFFRTSFINNTNFSGED